MRSKVKIVTVRGMAFPRGMTIDLLLDEKETETLYRKWHNEWGEPYGFNGGATAITCEQVVSVPVKELQKVYGKRLAEKYFRIAQENAAV